MRLSKFIICCILFAMPTMVFAVVSTGVVEEHESVHEADQEDNIEFSAYSYGAYNYLQSSKRFTSGVQNRAYDYFSNSLRLNQIYVQAALRPKRGVGGFVNVVVGSDAVFIAPDGFSSDVFNLKNFGLAVPEGYLQYRYDAFTVKVGLMLTLAGIESFVFTEDTNYSRSLVDEFAQPGKHIGVRLIRWMSERVRLIFGTTNGWGTVRDAGRQDGFEFGVDYHYKKKFTLTIDTYTVPDHLTDSLRTGSMGIRNLLDIFGTYNVTEKFQLAWNLDYGTQSKALMPFNVIGRAVWKGVDGYVNYKFDDKWRTSIRGEIFDDSDGYQTGVRQVLKEMTVTVGYKLLKHLEIMAETRHDFSNQNAFVNKVGVGSNPNQQSYALVLFYRTD